MCAETLRGTHSLRPALGGAGRAAWAVAIVAAPLLLAAHAAGLAAVLDAGNAFHVAALAALGILAADLGSGLVHWACDTWGDERTPFVGPHLIRAFREHHRDPAAIRAHDWVEVNRETAGAASAALLLLSLPAPLRVLEAHPGAWAFLWAFAAFGAAANQLHQWAHAERPPRAAGLAARAGLALSAARHGAHHRAPYSEAYCIATGWLNPALDRLGFWRGLERAVARATGAQPRAHPGPTPGTDPTQPEAGRT